MTRDPLALKALALRAGSPPWYLDIMRLPQWMPSRPDIPGIALAGSLGTVALIAAKSLPKSPFISDILIALFLGAIVVNTPLRRVVGLAEPSIEREPDRFSKGLRFTGNWVLRLGIILMGMKVQTGFFGRTELLLIACVAFAAIPTAFMFAHTMASAFGVRRPMADLLAGGTMICGASAVNAIAPIAGARREEQGIAIGVVFLFSIFALLVFRPVAALVGLDPHLAGLWSGLAVNDLSSAIAVGVQMGDGGGVMAAAAKSARILLLAPTLVAFSMLRRRDLTPVSLRKSTLDSLPGFLLGYVFLAVVRAAGDRLFAASAVWHTIIVADAMIVDLLLSIVSAGIGLHLLLRTLLATSSRAVAVGGLTSVWMAGFTLLMVWVGGARQDLASAGLIGIAGVIVTFGVYRSATAIESERKRLRQRFSAGAPLSLAEAMVLLDTLEEDGTIGTDDKALRKLLGLLNPTLGELLAVRESPLAHGEGCRWITYWEGRTGWALVAVCREAGSTTPIHAHPHRLLGKAIEGVLEELRFDQISDGEVELVSRSVLAHEELVETDGPATLHVVRAVGTRSAIDLQLRGPEMGKPGRRIRTLDGVDFATLAVGARVRSVEEIDDRPGHSGEGAGAGRQPTLAKTG